MTRACKRLLPRKPQDDAQRRRKRYREQQADEAEQPSEGEQRKHEPDWVEFDPTTDHARRQHIISKRRLKRGVFRSVVDLQAAINRFIADHNQQSRPFVWTADPDKIIAAATRGHQALDSIHAMGTAAVIERM